MAAIDSNMHTQTQIGAWINTPKPGVTLQIRNDLPIPKPGPGEILIKLLVTGFCHSDVHSIYGETPMDTNIAGHEGIGSVVGVGPDVSPNVIGKRVGLKWLYSACGNCEVCQVRSVYCPQQKNSGRVSHAKHYSDLAW